MDTMGRPRTLEGLRAVVFDFWMLGESDVLLVTGNRFTSAMHFNTLLIDHSAFSSVAGERKGNSVVVLSPTKSC